MTKKLQIVFLAAGVLGGCNLFGSVEPADRTDMETADAVADSSGDSSGPDAASDSGRDVAPPDMPSGGDMPVEDVANVDIGADQADACVPESEPSRCATVGANCGVLTLDDGCGGASDVDCGSCVAPQTCGALDANRCGCVAETEMEFCARVGATCGEIVDVDNCGELRTFQCGMCTSPQTCGGGGQDNTCGCTPESDAEFCSRLGKDCDAVTDVDNCGAMRTANCGSCQAGVTCGAVAPNVCNCPCFINGACVLDGGANPNNRCEVCDSAQSTATWTVKTGATCTDGDLCTENDVCSSSGVCAGTPVVCMQTDCNPAACNPATGACVTAPAPDFEPCTDDGLACTQDYCLSAVCTHPVVTGCAIDGACRVPNEAQGSGCEFCKPAQSVTSWTITGNKCAIGHVCYNDLAENPDSSCQICDTGMDFWDWTALPDASSCGMGGVCACNGGLCEEPMSSGTPCASP